VSDDGHRTRLLLLLLLLLCAARGLLLLLLMVNVFGLLRSLVPNNPATHGQGDNPCVSKTYKTNSMTLSSQENYTDGSTATLSTEFSAKFSG
jgi:hypothetical protein